MTTTLLPTKRTQPRPWPSALNFTEVCEYLGFTTAFAYKHRLDDVLREAGCLWRVPGTTHELYLRDKVDAWRERTWQAQQEAA